MASRSKVEEEIDEEGGSKENRSGETDKTVAPQKSYSHTLELGAYLQFS